MKQAHINITIIVIVVILLLVGMKLYKDRKKSKEEADRQKSDTGSGADYNKDKQADPTKLLDSTTLDADVKKLSDAYKNTFWSLRWSGVDENMSVVLSVAHSIDNQAQWAQILNKYAEENGADLYTDIKNVMGSSLPFVLPYQKEREEAIKKIKDFINTLPTGQ